MNGPRGRPLRPATTALPSFSLLDLDGKGVSDRTLAGATALVVAFICPHCPYVKHLREGLAQMARDYEHRNIAVVAINSNDATACSFGDPTPECRMQHQVEARLRTGLRVIAGQWR